MFNARLQPCAAGDRCHMKPALADPQHKCIKCRRHIHAICGVPDLNAINHMNSRFCYSCFPTVGLTPSPASSESTSTSISTTKTINLHQSRSTTATTSTISTTETINLHQSPSSTSTTSTITNSASSSSMNVKNYFDSNVQIDDSTNASSHILFAMATCLSDEEIQKNKIDDLLKNKKITKTAITSGINYIRNEIVRRVALINEEEERDGVASNKGPKLPRSKNWTKTKLTKWLCDHFLLGSEKA